MQAKIGDEFLCFVWLGLIISDYFIVDFVDELHWVLRACTKYESEEWYRKNHEHFLDRHCKILYPDQDKRAERIIEVENCSGVGYEGIKRLCHECGVGG